MPADEIHKNDIGTTIQATVKDGNTAVDLSSGTFTSIFFVFQDPAGTSNTQTATSFGTDGSDGIVNYIVNTTTVFGTIGAWSFQGIVQLTTTSIWHSDKHKFTVHPNL